MFDLPVDVPLNQVLKQVEDEHKSQVKAKSSPAAKLQPHHPRQPTSRHFEYDYINSAQQRDAEKVADNIAQQTFEQQLQKEKRMSMRKAETQAEYVPDSPRRPPPKTRAPPKDLYNKKQLEQIHSKEIHDGTLKRVKYHNALHGRLEQLQGDERAKRVSMVTQQKTENFNDKSEFEQAKDIERVKRQTILKSKVEIDEETERRLKVRPTQPSEHVDRLFEDGKKHHDRWQTRMFDPPVQVELKEVLQQVVKEEEDRVKKNANGEKPKAHLPRQNTILHHDYDFTTSIEERKVKAKESEDLEFSKTQNAEIIRRKTMRKESHVTEYKVDKPRAPPAEARALPHDAYVRKQQEQFKDASLVEKSNAAYIEEAERVQVQFKAQETRRQTTRQAKSEEEKKQRDALASSLNDQKEKRQTLIQQKIASSTEQQRPMTANDSAYSTRVDAGGKKVEMQYYDASAEDARPKTAPSQSESKSKMPDDDDNDDDEYEDDDNDDDEYEN